MPAGKIERADGGKSGNGNIVNFYLIREGNDPILVWHETGYDKDSPAMVGAAASLQRIYDCGYEDGFNASEG